MSNTKTLREEKLMKAKLPLIARLALGLIFALFGLNGLMMIITGSGFIPMPPPAPEFGEAMGGLFKLGYLMPLVKVLEIIGGVLLLIGVYKRLALILLIPIIVNIVGVHLFLDPSGLPIGILTTALAVYLVSVEWKGFSQLLVK
jgi:putative oxidoreductase